ncbi:MAG: hypothetical protein KatS3mg105_3682 [Gemmatales bacterium]|nr:MAG: hypothetical protein KatS3mg105_3682 [Gemmatales bacterium]
MVGPYYNKPTQEGYYPAFCPPVADAVDLPIFLYNIPGRTASNILPETIIRLAELPNIVGIKESTGLDGPGITDHFGLQPHGIKRRRQPDLALDESWRAGSRFRRRQSRSARHESTGRFLDQGRIEEARKLHYKLFPLCRDLLGVATNPIPVKTRDETARTRYWRAALAPFPARCRGGRQNQAKRFGHTACSVDRIEQSRFNNFRGTRNFYQSAGFNRLPSFGRRLNLMVPSFYGVTPMRRFVKSALLLVLCVGIVFAADDDAKKKKKKGNAATGVIKNVDADGGKSRSR